MNHFHGDVAVFNYAGRVMRLSGLSLDVLGALGPFGRRNAFPLAILLLLCAP